MNAKELEAGLKVLEAESTEIYWQKEAMKKRFIEANKEFEIRDIVQVEFEDSFKDQITMKAWIQDIKLFGFYADNFKPSYVLGKVNKNGTLSNYKLKRLYGYGINSIKAI